MLNLGSNKPARTTSLAVTLLLTISMVLMAGGTAQAAVVSKAATATNVAHNAQGKMTSRLEGTTKNGREVSGYFTPLKFIKKDGKVKVRGLVNGVVHNADGSERTFAALRTLRVKSINGTPATSARAAQARATCDVLHLNLAPLDLDLLGLQVHLDRVVLDIVAKTGAGNLLGNLLCADTGLLDGGLSGVLGKLTNLLNQILGKLGLGL
jgi:hypothetical protein